MGDLPVTFRQILLDDGLPLEVRRTVRLKEDGFGGGEKGEVGGLVGQLLGVDAVDGESFLRVANPRLQRLRKGKFAVFPHRLLVDGQGSGGGGGEGAGLAQLLHGLPVPEIHVPRGLGRGGFPAVDRHEGPVGQAGQEETSSPNAGVVTVHHSQGEGDGGGRIDGVAAGPQGLQAGLGGEGLDRGHVSLRGPG